MVELRDLQCRVKPVRDGVGRSEGPYTFDHLVNIFGNGVDHAPAKARGSRKFSDVEIRDPKVG